jgi:6-phosphogluconolactonase
VTVLTSCADAEGVARRTCEVIVRALEEAQEAGRAIHIALTGGDSPRRTYELLAREPDRWGAAQVWFGDERCVAPEDEQSNYRLAADTLLEPAEIPASRIHRMRGELGPDQGARRYEHELRTALAIPRGAPVLDLILLGIGPEGHVASLFPEAEALEASAEQACVGVRNSPKPPPERITLTMPVLRAARRCVLIAAGQEKADAVAAMLAEPSPRVPASLLRRDRLTVIVDDAASPEAQRD